jgi:transcription factor E2F7/8
VPSQKTGGKRGNTAKSSKTTKYKKVKSLGHFCQQFIVLFVSWKRVISLEEAARSISDGEKIDEKTLKTKIRRLYDIANVLQSIGLITKTQMSKNRKPAFQWVGLQGSIESLKEIKELVKKTHEVQ